MTALRNVSIVLNRRRITCNFLDLGPRFQSLLRSLGVFDNSDATLTFTSDHAEGGVLDVKIRSVNTGRKL